MNFYLFLISESINSTDDNETVILEKANDAYDALTQCFLRLKKYQTIKKCITVDHNIFTADMLTIGGELTKCNHRLTLDQLNDIYEIETNIENISKLFSEKYGKGDFIKVQ